MVTDLAIDISMDVEIAASPERVWSGLVADRSRRFVSGEGRPMGLGLEPRVGGRWFRDLSPELGPGVGHLWGHVQVYKPPRLLELLGPMALSYPCTNHVTFRLEPTDDAGTLVRLIHRAVGSVPEGAEEAMESGWIELLGKGLKSHVERGN